METDTQERVESVDLSKLINFGVTFEPLQITLEGILRRLRHLEKDKAAQAKHIEELGANVASLEEANKVLQAKVEESAIHTTGSGATEAVPQAAENDAIWEEISRINSILGELQHGNDKDRHTIDELYAARKKRQSMTAFPSEQEPSTMPTVSGGAPAAVADTGAGGRKKSSFVAASSPVNASTGGARSRRPTSAKDPDLPIGDRILSLAHEDLEVDTPAPYKAFVEPSGDDDMSGYAAGAAQQPSRRQPSASGASAARPSVGGQDTASRHSGSGGGGTNNATDARAPSGSGASQTTAAPADAASPHAEAHSIPIATTATGAPTSTRRSTDGSASAVAAATAQPTIHDSPSHNSARNTADADGGDDALSTGAAASNDAASVSRSRPSLGSKVSPGRHSGGGGSVNVTVMSHNGSNAGAGGEDAGEHRDSMSPPATQQRSRAASMVPRRSLVAGERLAAAAARRASQFAAGAAPPSPTATPAFDGQDSKMMEEEPTAPQSVFDRLQKDGDAIAYLNRVVAEILSEMKTLHADMDELRGQQDGAVPEERGLGEDGAPTTGAVLTDEDYDELLQRLTQVETEVADTKQQTQRRDDALQEELDELKKQLRVARGLTDEDVDALRSGLEIAEKLKTQEERLRVVEAVQNAMKAQVDSVLSATESPDGTALEISPAQFMALQGAVRNVEKEVADLQGSQGGQQDWSGEVRKLTDALHAVEGDVAAAQDQLQRTVKETLRLQEEKANRSELSDTAAVAERKRHSSTDSAAMAELTGRLSRAEGNVQRLSDDKADRAGLQLLRGELEALKAALENVKAAAGGMADGRPRSGGASTSGGGGEVSALQAALKELQTEVQRLKEMQQIDGAHGGNGTVDEESLEELRDRIERLDRCKADATLVANKAERDYVENALERLMREVEQVLNATNAGLIDTLEKSLNILRDMIDGKATKQDIANLQGWMAETNGGAGGAGGAPDGLTGFKGFRCLGCNRPMENMRPRTLPATMAPFLNRNPQNLPQDNVTRTIQQQQQVAAQQQSQQSARLGGPSKSFTVGGRQFAGSPDAAPHRSTSSEPLPRIEP